MNTDPQEFTDWLSSNYLVDTAVFISDEVAREKVKATNPTRMAWKHQQQFIDKLEKKLAIATRALGKLQRLGNEPYIGNSIGNDIASKALNKIKDTE